jgi:hypothetical protein
LKQKKKTIFEKFRDLKKIVETISSNQVALAKEVLLKNFSSCGQCGYLNGCVVCNVHDAGSNFAMDISLRIGWNYKDEEGLDSLVCVW